MNEPHKAGGVVSKSPVSRTRRSVTLVFGMPQQKSELSMRALIDGGLARLIAAKVAAIVLMNDKHAQNEGPMRVMNHAKNRRNKL